MVEKICPEIKVFVDANEKVNLDVINKHIQVTRVAGDFASTGAGAVAYHLKTSPEKTTLDL